MQLFSTSDLALAATLLHKNYTLHGLNRASRRVEFQFEDTDELRDTVDRYWRNDLHCPAQALLASLKQAKHILYDYQT